LQTFSDERFVVPICTAMGFAHVLRYTQCDRHLVHLLVRPLRHARSLLVPGTVVVGFLVNMPIVSQTSTAVTIGLGGALFRGSSVGCKSRGNLAGH
jgi:DcuC family C4-dicarboxylate transporter